MTGLKDIVNFILPIPPFVLERDGDFPSCEKLYGKLFDNNVKGKELGSTFIRVSRLTGFAWLTWFVHFGLFMTGIVVLLYNYGCGIEMGTPHYGGVLSARQIIAIVAALLVFLKVMFYTLTFVSLQLSGRCYTHLGIEIEKG